MKPELVLWIIAGILIGVCFTGAAFAARPGEVDDPLISLSYLKTAGGFQFTQLDEGEQIDIAPGQEFVLIKGELRLECPCDFKLYDLTRGKSYKNPRSIGEGSLSVFIGNSAVTIHAGSGLECLLRGFARE